MLALGLVPTVLARKARSRPTSILVFHKSLFPVEGSAIFMLILWDLYQFLAVLIIFLPWWIWLLGGLRSLQDGFDHSLVLVETQRGMLYSCITRSERHTVFYPTGLAFKNYVMEGKKQEYWDRKHESGEETTE